MELFLLTSSSPEMYKIYRCVTFPVCVSVPSSHDSLESYGISKARPVAHWLACSDASIFWDVAKSKRQGIKIVLI